ncbi:MAG: hypothetical protein ACOX6T_09315 [Myxococcales bacterium]|jgi:hypothetical protein
MSLLPEDAGYLEQLQAFFLAFRGDGVSLSPLDAELLRAWHEQGVPYEVVCRGIRRVAESLVLDGQVLGRVRTLRSCRKSVEREFRRWAGLSAGRTEKPAEEKSPADYATERLKKARKLIEKALSEADLPLRAALEAIRPMLEDEAADPREVSKRIARADEALVLGYLRRLPFAERQSLTREARSQAGPRRSGSSARARKDALRAHLVALVRAKKGLLAFG